MIHMPFLVTIKRSGGCTCSFSFDPEVHEEAAPSIYLKVLKRIRVNKVNHGKTAQFPSFAACDDNTLKSIYFSTRPFSRQLRWRLMRIAGRWFSTEWMKPWSQRWWLCSLWRLVYFCACKVLSQVLHRTCYNQSLYISLTIPLRIIYWTYAVT